MINKYIKKPVVIEAVRWSGSNEEEIRQFAGEGAVEHLDILGVGGYIVKGENGKFEAYSRAAFHEIFQRHLVWEDNI